MTLESKINFRVGQTVMFNPDNHGFKLNGAYQKVKTGRGVIKKVETVYKVDSDFPTEVPTGRIVVQWEGISFERIHKSKHLKIV